VFPQSRWPIWSAPTLVAGLFWISTAAASSMPQGLPLWVVGSALLASGGGQLFAPGDHRITQIGALAGLVGALLSLPLALVVGLGNALGLLLTAALGSWGAGRLALDVEKHVAGVPTPEISPSVVAKVAGDELILGFEQVLGTAGFALDGTIDRVVSEMEDAHSFFAREGFLDKPEAYHVAPPDLTDPEIRIESIAGHRVEVLRFESGYRVADGEPGRDRWMGYDACRDGWAYVLRHEGPPRPWLIATNGYRMGHARIDIDIFKRFFHDSKGGSGVNVLIPVLPLHGPRRLGWHSGSGFLGIDVLDTIHAETQALWDMRRLLSWTRTQEAPAIGAFGLSLGGLTTANFASLAEGLACAIPGIPLVDISRILVRHAGVHQLRYAETLGFDVDRVAELLRVINPLWLSPQVPREGRMIFGGTADRLVTPDHVRDLWRHWEEPEMVWYQGSHISFMKERSVWAGVDRTLRENGLSS